MVFEYIYVGESAVGKLFGQRSSHARYVKCDGLGDIVHTLKPTTKRNGLPAYLVATQPSEANQSRVGWRIQSNAFRSFQYWRRDVCPSPLPPPLVIASIGKLCKEQNVRKCKLLHVHFYAHDVILTKYFATLFDIFRNHSKDKFLPEWSQTHRSDLTSKLF